MPDDSPTPAPLPERMSVTVIIEGGGFRRSLTCSNVPRVDIYNELAEIVTVIRRGMWDYGLVKDPDW
jgi:hypothetical protein